MKKVLLAIAAIVIVLGVVLYFAAAPFLINKTVNKMRTEAGVTIKSVNIPDFKLFTQRAEPVTQSSCFTALV
jgi:hypothetical protein